MKMIAIAALAAVMVLETASAQAIETETLVRAAKCEALLISQAKTYTAISTLLTGTNPVLLDAATKRNAGALVDSFQRFSDASMRRAQVLDTYARTLLPDQDAEDIYTKTLDYQTKNMANMTLKAANGPLPAPSVIEEMSKTAMACAAWIDAEVMAKNLN